MMTSGQWTAYKNTANCPGNGGPAGPTGPQGTTNEGIRGENGIDGNAGTSGGPGQIGNVGNQGMFGPPSMNIEFIESDVDELITREIIIDPTDVNYDNYKLFIINLNPPSGEDLSPQPRITFRTMPLDTMPPALFYIMIKNASYQYGLEVVIKEGDDPITLIQPNILDGPDNKLVLSKITLLMHQIEAAPEGGGGDEGGGDEGGGADDIGTPVGYWSVY